MKSEDSTGQSVLRIAAVASGALVLVFGIAMSGGGCTMTETKLDMKVMQKLYVDRFRQEFPFLDLKVEESKWFSNTVDSPGDQVPGLDVCVDAYGIIVCWGDLWHAHFDRENAAREVPAEALHEAVVANALDLISDISSDKVVLVEKLRGKVIVQAFVYVAGDTSKERFEIVGSLTPSALNLFRPLKTREYLWSRVIK